jgi:hypothetical protein
MPDPTQWLWRCCTSLITEDSRRDSIRFGGLKAPTAARSRRARAKGAHMLGGTGNWQDQSPPSCPEITREPQRVLRR